MAHADSTELAKGFTVKRYRELKAKGDRAACSQLIVRRFEERYFDPVVDHPKRHGMTMMAIGCLVIEALECFYQGRSDSKGKSEQMFESFLKRPTGLEALGGAKNWFYKQIRCGILHQAETDGGWRIQRRGPLLDTKMRVINAKRFIDLLQAAVASYARQLETDADLWKNFKKNNQERN